MLRSLSAALALVVCLLPVTASAAPSSGGPPVQGLWQGGYTCAPGQGESGTEVRITETADGALDAVVDIYPTPQAALQFPRGSYRATAEMKPGGKLVLTPRAWITQPPRMAFSVVEAQLSADSRSMTGTVVGCGPQSTLAVRKVSDDPSAPGSGVAAGPAGPAASAVGESGGGFFARVLQGVKKGLSEAGDPVIVRGYIAVSQTDMSMNPLCLFNLRTRELQANGVFGVEAVTHSGAPAFKSSAVSLQSCTKAEANGDLVVTNYTGMSPEATPFRGAKGLPSLGQTPLMGIFARHPYDGTPATEYPRVAVTVTDWMSPGCWTARATVWDSPKHEQSVAPFTVCWPLWGGSMAGANRLMEGDTLKTQLEAQQAGAPGAVGASTGNVRTTGPKAPLRATPERLPATVQRGPYLQFVRALVMATGWIQGAPTNLWIVGFSPEANAR